jgi:dTDP-4-amino-4,6-dideoxygalactose transaminase
VEPYQQFERDFGAWAGVSNVVGCSSGTAALHLALESLKLPPGSSVLVPDYTMVACARAVTLAGLTPVFVDCGDDLLMRPDLLHGGAGFPLTTSAIMAVHVYGRRCDMGRVAEFAEVNGLAVIEDLAEAHGVKPHSFTDAAYGRFYKQQDNCRRGGRGGRVPRPPQRRPRLRAPVTRLHGIARLQPRSPRPQLSALQRPRPA